MLEQHDEAAALLEGLLDDDMESLVALAREHNNDEEGAPGDHINVNQASVQCVLGMA